MVWTRKKLIESYLDFFKSKNHKEILNSNLIPENDPTVLFTTAGMHPIVPFLLGEKHPQGKRLCNVQKCIRTGDIEEVGDSYHHTFFEMLGNWSLGDYFKKEAIEFSFEFLTKVLEIPKEKLAVSCFAGDKDSPKDEESAKIWKKLGIPDEKIVFLSKENNWWGPAGKTGPCGPDTEMFYYVGNKVPKNFNPKDSKWLEIWNDVFMQYTKNERGNYLEAKQKNIDTGMGVERTLTILNNLEDNYLTEIWQPIIKEIEKISRKKYSEYKKEMRIIADHIKASVMIISEGIVPGNVEQGYVLRRLIRRAIRYGNNLEIKNFTAKLIEPIIKIYKENYPELNKNKKFIINELEKEENKFEKTLEIGLSKLKKFVSDGNKLCGKDAFLLYQSYGFPIEMIKEEVEKLGMKFPDEECKLEFEKHRNLSKTATQGKFKSGLADNTEATTKLHTATHLLLAALRKVLKNEGIIQKGSNITSERLRLDFSFDRKLTDDEIKKVEELVNQQIKRQCPVKKEEMSPECAKKHGATGIFDKKYREKVSVYSIENFSKEICAGPHVKNLKELGKFKILKEESSSAGVRRIKAILEN